MKKDYDAVKEVAKLKTLMMNIVKRDEVIERNHLMCSIFYALLEENGEKFKGLKDNKRMRSLFVEHLESLVIELESEGKVSLNEVKIIHKDFVYSDVFVCEN